MERPSGTTVLTNPPIITTVTIQPNEHPPVSDQPGITYVQIAPGYFKTLGGILLLVELLLAVICMACASPARHPGTSWFLFVVVISFIISLLWVFIHLLSINHTLNIGIPWISLEFGYNFGATILYFTAFIVQFSVWGPSLSSLRSSNIAAAVFGLFNFILYGLGTYILYKEKNAPAT